MSVTKKSFGFTKEGSEIFEFTLENKKGMKAVVINYGAILTQLWVPDSKGELKDVVLGYDTAEAYAENGSFFGATIGPNANRIANASFEIDGIKYNLDVNDGPNNLHSHFELGYHKFLFLTTQTDDSVTFLAKDSDGNMGFPGNKDISVTYSLSEDCELKIHYDISADKKTIINMTNHSYFNLNGHDGGKIEDHVLTLNASKYTPVIEGAIPTGELADVKGTVFDFTSPKRVGEDINKDVEQLILVKGYDHNWVVDNVDGTVKKIAHVSAKGTDRQMEVYSDLPAVQFYAGNCIAPTVGKGGAEYSPRCGLCLETQYSPDTANRPEWPSAVYGPDRKYESTTIYKFV